MMRFLIAALSWLQTSFILRIFKVRPERRTAFLESRFFETPIVKEPVTWFHASSLGELEMLYPLIEDFHAKGLKVGVSAFSDSALPGLKALRSICVYADLSPREDEWIRLFHRFKINKVILAKYDFWPGLLFSAMKTRVPVMVINAQMRKSMLVSLRLFKILSTPFPKLYLFANDLAAQGELSANLKNEASVFLASDPRWERVARRKDNPKQSLSFELIKKKIETLARPIGIVGSAWSEDLAVVLPAFKKRPGTMIVVPHDLSKENREILENQIKEAGLQNQVLCISEMGILVELYQFADWVVVGGGFGKGIHSLLEPASYGIPIACGPNRYDEFRETKELAASGLLTRIENTQDLSRWFESEEKGARNSGFSIEKFLIEKRRSYRALLDACLRIQ